MSTLKAIIAAAASALLLACASSPTAPVVTPPASRAPVAPAPATTPDAELPDGRGKQILAAACTSCHDLREVTKFRGYYDRAQWRDIVVTMVEYGAPVQKNDIEVLADYLNEHLGRLKERR